MGKRAMLAFLAVFTRAPHGCLLAHASPALGNARQITQELIDQMAIGQADLLGCLVHGDFRIQFIQDRDFVYVAVVGDSRHESKRRLASVALVFRLLEELSPAFLNRFADEIGSGRDCLLLQLQFEAMPVISKVLMRFQSLDRHDIKMLLEQLPDYLRDLEIRDISKLSGGHRRQELFCFPSLFETGISNFDPNVVASAYEDEEDMDTSASATGVGGAEDRRWGLSGTQDGVGVSAGVLPNPSVSVLSLFSSAPAGGVRGAAGSSLSSASGVSKPSASSSASSSPYGDVDEDFEAIIASHRLRSSSWIARHQTAVIAGLTFVALALVVFVFIISPLFDTWPYFVSKEDFNIH